MPSLTLLPLHWAGLPELREVAPLDDEDLACMSEVREVLARRGRLGRFALHLVHKHFDLAADEVLVEYSDAGRREQWLRVEPRDAEALRDAIATTWVFEGDKPYVACVCASREGQGHLGRHESSPSPAGGSGPG